ncbi:hypothetical protein [Streptomyces fructofermentans]|uniref:hypothetical protein n=1 Tax=Streptomyces fructofermentans TaxID=152141 RepID=UPI0037BA0D10
MREDHPVDLLLVSLDPVPTDSAVTRLRCAVEGLTHSRSWVIGPPGFVDELDADGRRTVGLTLSLFTALPPWRDEIDETVDRAHLEEIKLVIDEVCRISAEVSTSFTVHLAGVLVGQIDRDGMDSLLRIGLIGEWERILEADSGPS